MLAFLNLVPSIFFLVQFVPLVGWWGTPFSVAGAFLAQFLFIYIILYSRKRKLLALCQLIVASAFYYQNFVETISQQNCDLKIAFSFDEATKSFNAKGSEMMLGEERNSLNQKLGKVSLTSLTHAENTKIQLAYVKTEDLFSAEGWRENKILLRRLTSILRQIDTPMLVILDSTVPAGSSLVSDFMFQARLESKKAENSLAAMFGIGGRLYLSRGLRLCKSDDRVLLGLTTEFGEDQS